MPTIEEAPERVARVAQDRKLGPLLMATKGSNPFANFLTALAGVALLVGGMAAVGWLGWGFLRPVLVVALALALLWTFYAVVSLVTGFQRFFLFAGGVVRWRNGGIRAVTWPEVGDVRRLRAFGRRSGYQLTPLGGGKVLVLEAVEGNEPGDEMARHFEQAAAAAGVHVWD
jgi:hypothetical protein